MQRGAWRVNGIPILNTAVVDTLRFIRRVPRPITKSTIYLKMLGWIFLVYWLLFTWGGNMLIRYCTGEFDGLWGLLAWIVYTIFLFFILVFKLWHTHQDYLQVMTSRCWSESVGLDPPLYFGSKFNDGKIKVKQQASFLFMAGPVAAHERDILAREMRRRRLERQYHLRGSTERSQEALIKKHMQDHFPNGPLKPAVPITSSTPHLNYPKFQLDCWE